MTKLPPRNLRAEEFLLGILLRCPAKLAEVEVEGLLAIDDYSKSFHGRIYQTIADMRAAGEPVIPLTVTNKMIQDGTWEKDTRLTLLSDLDAGCPPVDDVTTWARRVREVLLFRQVHEEATRLAQITTSESMDRYANACDTVDQLFTLVTHGFGVEEPWDPPRPLNVSIPPLPDIPGVLGDVVTHVADVTQSPPDLAYLTALGTITAATLGQITVQLKSGWEEPLTILPCPPPARGCGKARCAPSSPEHWTTWRGRTQGPLNPVPEQQGQVRTPPAEGGEGRAESCRLLRPDGDQRRGRRR